MADLPLTHRDNIAARLVALRKAMGYTQAAFADLTGIKRTAWANYESGLRRIEIDSAYKVRAKTGVPLDWIYAGDDAFLPRRIAEALAQADSLAGKPTTTA